MEGVRELSLAQGSNVTAVIKASDVLVSGAAGTGFGPVGGVTVTGPQSPGSPPRSPDPAGSWLVRPIAPQRPTVVGASDDPALPLCRSR